MPLCAAVSSHELPLCERLTLAVSSPEKRGAGVFKLPLGVGRRGSLLHRLDGRLLPLGALRSPRVNGLTVGGEVFAVALPSAFAALFGGVILLGSGHALLQCCR